jgi:hypothetical protein
MNKSPIYELIKAEVDRSGKLFIKDKIDPWLFFNSHGVKISKSDGSMINISGVEFSGSAPLVFWNGFVNEELTVLALSLFENTKRMATEHGVPVENAISDCNDCLKDLIFSVFDRMADIDQRLRGKGYPRSIPKKNIEGHASSLYDQINKYAAAHIAAAKEASTAQSKKMTSLLSALQPGWYAKPPAIILLGVIAGLLATALWYFYVQQ